MDNDQQQLQSLEREADYYFTITRCAELINEYSFFSVIVVLIKRCYELRKKQKEIRQTTSTF